ncbi:MAG: four helix bundle protein [Deltaproteobacteria bacterium]|nr:four helix bundle protein [Deltaproteobacteria bacterium]MBW1815574.1 four helix bundle protein [Deltaproteobacteria bacterium]
MDNKEFARLLEKRTREFALLIIKLSTLLPNTPEANVIRYQLTKAGTSVGANYREANRARSKADFKNRAAICQSEASESQYWLEIILDMDWLPQKRVDPVYQECSELLGIFTAICTNR